MKASTIDLSSVTFTFDEVMTILGKEVDLEGKYEKTEDNAEVAMFEYSDDDSDAVFGEKLCHYANQVSDITANNVIRKQRNRVFKLAVEKGAIKWQ